jgi:phosphoribosylanthranilate isomerase
VTPFIKICGLRSYDEARLALDTGATALGFLVGLTHRSEDEITAATAADIVRSLPPDTLTVLVTHLTDPARIAALADEIRVRAIQVHGEAPAASVAELRRLSPDRRLIKAIHVTGPEALAHARSYADVADALLLDTRTTDRLGGTGQTHDWSISRRIVSELAPMPVYLAGGLTAETVERAIVQVRPAGVDVNSGVEDAGGGKHVAKLAAFVLRAWTALGSRI